jgi:hypothetical protein
MISKRGRVALSSSRKQKFELDAAKFVAPDLRHTLKKVAESAYVQPRGHPCGGKPPTCQKGARHRSFSRDSILMGNQLDGNAPIGGERVATFVASIARFPKKLNVQITQEKDVIKSAKCVSKEPRALDSPLAFPALKTDGSLKEKVGRGPARPGLYRSQLIWSQNRGCYRARRFMFSGRYS